jgi:DNA-directed RNA polymerase specialized sigma subunit
MMMAFNRFDPTKGVSLGAFAQRYIFGRIYRSLLGTKNLQHNKKMILLESSEKIKDQKQENDEFLLHLYDHIMSKYNVLETQVLTMFFQNYKKTEIIRIAKITTDQFDLIIQDFKNNF